MSKSFHAEHGVVCDMADQTLGYFGWPTVGRLEDGTLIVASSGLRMQHVDPTGRTVILISRDDGASWSSPRVINDSPFDDRDGGVIGLGGEKALVTWFTSDTRHYVPGWEKDYLDVIKPGMTWQTEAWASKFVGAWTSRTEDGGATWTQPTRCPVNSPHGPTRLKSGDLLYLGKVFNGDMVSLTAGKGDVIATTSRDDGETWDTLGVVPYVKGTSESSLHEAHVCEAPSGKLVGLIRVERVDADLAEDGLQPFSHIQTESSDGGRTWTTPKPWGFRGSPPHLMTHSTGAIVCVYGHREATGSGQRASISHDEGATWTHSLILRDDGPDTDLGYPSSVELDDGSIFTVYYQKPRTAADKPALLSTRWRLPE